MDRRRALLSGGAKEPLYIYQPGYTAFKNATYNELTAEIEFKTDYVRVFNPGNGTTLKAALYIDFTGYKKLVYEIATVSTSNASYTKAGWQNVGSDPITGETVSTTRKKYESDISSLNGQKIFSMQAGKHNGFYLYDLHLE